MTYTTYRCPSDKEIARSQARGRWQERLVAGLEAWDGSTIEDVPFIRQARIKGVTVSRFGTQLERHIQDRRNWIKHLTDRLQQAGLSVVLDGPNARIEATNAAPDTPMVAEIAKQYELTCLPIIFHSISIEDRVGDVPVFRCVVSEKYNWQPKVRVERFVVGRPDVMGSGLSMDDHICDTPRKARIRAKKVAAKQPEWDNLCAQRQREMSARRAAEKEQRAATAGQEDDLFAIASAFDAKSI